MVDDHPVLRAGLRQLLEADDRLSVVGEAATVDDALVQVRVAQPDVVLLDIRLDSGNGLGAQLVAADQADAATAPADPLSPREREVLRLLALGHTNREIGLVLEISVRTVETHRTRMMRKLGAENRADLVGYARSIGLV